MSARRDAAHKRTPRPHVEADLAAAREQIAAKDAELDVQIDRYNAMTIRAESAESRLREVEAERDALRGDSEFRLMREQLASACAEVNRLRADLWEMAWLWNSHSEWWGKDGSKHDIMITLARKYA